jgi:TfoX/Sxy family transcriptional regulator of competence genes
VAYDEELAERMRDLLLGEPGVSEKRMFGGVGFMVDGNLAVAASSRGGMLVRVDPDAHEALLGEPHAAPFEMRGRSLRGWLFVDPAGLRGDEQLEEWVGRGVDFARSLPSK